MRFVDEIILKAKAGHGGDGVVRWRREKFIPKGGPSGGDGGRGGNVYARAIRDIGALSKYTTEKLYKAENGEPGGSSSKHGGDGKDFTFNFPVGSIITNTETGLSIQLETEGQQELLLKGGYGGKGNEQFKSSINVAPKEATSGKVGEEAKIKIVLELLADVGLIGLPSAGKSSLLNALTNAHAKVGEYAFTTLDPNLGDFYGFILADIPGLIEGASAGKGLGTKFLRHIKRTKTLVHLVSCELGMNMMKAYKQVRNELETYGQGLSEKPEIILLTKIDTIDEKTLEKKIKEFQKLKKSVYVVTLFDDVSVKAFTKAFVKELKK